MLHIPQDQIVSQNLIICEKGTHNHLINTCSSLLSVAVLKTMTKGTLGRKGLTSLRSIQTIRKESQSRNLETGTEAGTMERQPAGSFPVAGVTFFFTQPRLSVRRGTAYFSH